MIKEPTQSLAPNTLAFMALSNEYCHALETVAEKSPDEFVVLMTRLLPRIYMTAADLTRSAVALGDDDACIDRVLDENHYEAVRASVSAAMGGEDVYLEVFEEDMKYSDTPVTASLSEGLTDIFQVLYDFLETVRDAPDEIIDAAVMAVKEDFEAYWSAKLCNVMRPLNALRYSSRFDDTGI